MGKFLKKAAIAGAVALAFGSSAYADVTMTGSNITARINDAGNFASYYESAPIGTPGLQYNGIEFVNWGTPISWYWLEAGGSNVAALGGNPLGASTVVSVPNLITTTYAFGGLSFVQTATIAASNQLSISVSMTNVGSSAISGVQYGVGFDPDQGISATGWDYSTVNTITGQGNNAGVKAAYASLGPDGTVLLKNTTSAAAYSIGAYIDPYSCCSTIAPSTILSGAQAVGYSLTGDNGIALGYDIGTLGIGQTATIGYAYIFAPVPEPETYAMLIAGLGLMGFVARRRQKKLAVT